MPFALSRVAPCRRPLASALLAFFAFGALSASAQDARPVRSLAEPAGAPLFVPASLAGRPDGSLDWDLLGAKAEEVFNSVANAKTLPAPVHRPNVPTQLGAPDPAYSRPIADCLYYAPGSFEASGRATEKTLNASLRSAKGVVRGRVVGVTPGFFGGDIGSLVDLDVEETLKASSGVASTKRLRLYYPAASFRAGSFSFCKADPAYPALPEIGDDVLVIHRRPPLDEGRGVLLPEPDGIFVQKSGGKVEVPQALRDDASLAASLDMTGLTSAGRIRAIGSAGSAESASGFPSCAWTKTAIRDRLGGSTRRPRRAWSASRRPPSTAFPTGPRPPPLANTTSRRCSPRSWPATNRSPCTGRPSVLIR